MMFLALINTYGMSVDAKSAPSSVSVMFVMDSVQSANSLKTELPKEVRIIDRYQNFVVINFPKAATKIFERLEHSPGVIEVTPGIPTRYLGDVPCNCESKSPISVLNDQIQETSCRVTKFCKPSGRERLWAQKAIATDLAQKYLKEKNIPRSTKVAVVDSGFDKTILDNLDSPERLKVKPALVASKGYNEDPVGHGSRVTSLIKGAGGIGGSSQSNVSVYGFGQGGVSTAEIGNAVLRACDDGNQVINVSMGTDINGLASLPLFQQFPKSLINNLTRKGCLIVHAAGNESGFINLSTKSPFEIQVGATTPFGEKADFSSVSNFMAPGQNVIGLDTGKDGSDDIDSCGENPLTIKNKASLQTFSSGTSFAAPLFTSELALTRDMLMTSSVFQSKSKSDQAILLSQISQASQIGLNANSYLAVRIAETWAKNPTLKPEQAKEKLMSEMGGKCLETPNECHANNNSCVNENSCENKRRELAIICQNKSSQETSQLIDSMQKKGDLEGAAYWAKAMAQQNPNKKLDIPFPTEEMQSEINRSTPQSDIARWVKYYSEWKQESTETSPANEEYLASIANHSLQDGINTVGREHSLSAHEDLTQLFVSMEKAALVKPKTLEDWTVKLQTGTPAQNRFYLEALAKGESQGVVPKNDLLSILDRLTGPDTTEIGVKGAIQLINVSEGLNSQDRFRLANKVLNSNFVNDDTLSGLVTLGINHDHLDKDLIAFESKLSKNPNLGHKTAEEIIETLWVYKSDIIGAEKPDVESIVETLSKVSNRNELSDVMLSSLKAELAKK